jgi:hypothetical protein
LKVISLQLKGDTSTEWQFHVAHICFTVTPTTFCPLHTPSLDPLTSRITYKDIIPCTTYNKTLLPSPVTCILIHAHCPSSSLKMSGVQPSPTAANIFAVKETSFPLSSVNVNDGELGHLSRCSKPQCSGGYT